MILSKSLLTKSTYRFVLRLEDDDDRSLCEAFDLTSRHVSQSESRKYKTLILALMVPY